MTTKIISIVALASLFAVGRGLAADKLRIAYVSPSMTMAVPWMAKELGILAKNDLAAEILLITGSPRLVQTLISGDVDLAFAGMALFPRCLLNFLPTRRDPATLCVRARGCAATGCDS